MVIGNSQTIILVGLTSLLTLGCSVSKNFNEYGHPPPIGWLDTPANDRGHCTELDETYLNLGLGRQTKKDELAQARLDVALGHAFPSLEMPNKVSIKFDSERELLKYQFHGPVNKSYSTTVRCSQGWLTWTKTITDKYVGDGGNLDYSIRKIKATKTLDGSLIIHLVLDTQFSSFGIFKSRSMRETWSKFQSDKKSN